MHGVTSVSSYETDESDRTRLPRALNAARALHACYGRPLRGVVPAEHLLYPAGSSCDAAAFVIIIHCVFA